MFEELWKRHEGTNEPPHPAILAYIHDLERRYPDLDAVGDLDESPWAEGHMIGNVMGPFFYFAMTYPGARKALSFVAETAAEHDLVCFDPQSMTLI